MVTPEPPTEPPFEAAYNEKRLQFVRAAALDHRGLKEELGRFVQDARRLGFDVELAELIELAERAQYALLLVQESAEDYLLGAGDQIGVAA